MRLIVISLGLGLTACASDAVRPTAVATMSLTQGFKKEMAEFSGRQNVEIDAARRRIALERREAQVSAFRGEKQRMDWRSSKSEEALRLFEEATRPRSGPALASLIGPVPTSSFTASAVKPDTKKYDALVKALKPLAGKRSSLEDAKFLLTFGQEVVEQMKEDMAEAAEAGAEAAASDAAADPGN